MIEVIAKLDKSSRARLSWIQSFAASFGIVPRPIYGHITLARIEEDQVEACKALLADQAAFTVDFTQVEVLRQEKIIAALAAREGALEEIYSKLAPNAPWTPHTELLRDDMMDLGWVKPPWRACSSPSPRPSPALSSWRTVLSLTALI